MRIGIYIKKYGAGVLRGLSIVLISIVMLSTMLGATVFANTNGTGQRSDSVMGTFTEGMFMGADEDSGDSVMRSAPTPKDDPEPQQQNVPIHIEIAPEVNVPKQQQ